MGRKNRLPVPCTAPSESTLRAVPGCLGAGTPGDGERHGDGSGSGLQLNVVQPGPGEGDFPLAFVLAFTRELIRYTVSGDAVYLAITAAATEVPVTKEHLRAFAHAVRLQQETKGYYPKGF